MGNLPGFTIDLDVATQDAFTRIGPFDSRDMLTVAVELDVAATTTPGVGNDTLDVQVITRRAGLPWQPVPTAGGSNGLTFAAAVEMPIGATGLGAVAPGSFLAVATGLLDETTILAEPVDHAGAANGTASVLGGHLVFGATMPFSAQGLFTFAAVDPGAPNQPLAITSDDGYALVIHLATDGGGIVTTTTDDIVATGIAQGAYIAALANQVLGHLVAPFGPVPIAGATNGTVTMTYSLKGQAG